MTIQEYQEKYDNLLSQLNNLKTEMESKGLSVIDGTVKY
jgi:hypothetical protein